MIMPPPISMHASIVLCCIKLCCVVLYCVVLYCIVLCCVNFMTPFGCADDHATSYFHACLYRIVLYCIVLSCVNFMTAFGCADDHATSNFHACLHCIVLYCVVLCEFHDTFRLRGWSCHLLFVLCCVNYITPFGCADDHATSYFHACLHSYTMYRGHRESLKKAR